MCSCERVHCDTKDNLLRGTVLLTLTKEKKVRGIYVRIHGAAFAQWTEEVPDYHASNSSTEQNTGTKYRTETFTGNEDYLDEKTYFVGGESGEIKISEGTHRYTFECALPGGLPTSVEGSNGHIRYTASVVLHIPIWPDKKFSVPFTVIKPIDLNFQSWLKAPVRVDKDAQFNFCCLLCCWYTDPMRIIARMPVGGYTPGQTINLELNVNNRSGQSVSEFTVQLLKIIEYMAYSYESRQRTEFITIVEKNEHGLAENQDEIIRVNLEVPAVPPTDFETSNIVKVRYSIKVVASVGGCHKNPTLELPITIGTSLILDDQSLYPHLYPNAVDTKNNQMGVISQQPSAPQMPPYPDQNEPSASAHYPSAPSAPNYDPPTYEVEMSGRT